jgi:hypothetical protein
MKTNKNLTRLLLAGVLTTAVYVSCKKDTKAPGRGLPFGSTRTSHSKLSNGYNGISYDPGLGMLVFKDMASFNNAMNLLSGDVKKFQHDNGRTTYLLQLLSQKTHGDELYDTLANNSPLSDTVLITLLKGNHDHLKKKELIELNIDFSEKVASVYDAITLEPAIRQEIDGKRFDHVPHDRVLDEFEAQFPGYISYRDNLNQTEMSYLKSGNDPAGKGSPFSTQTLSRVMGTLFDAKQEVKIGNTFVVYLQDPIREIQINNNRIDILNYIRANGNIPFNPVLAKEPANGFPIASAPPLVDTNIIVTPNGGLVDQENGCGGGIVINGENSAARSKAGIKSYAFSFAKPDSTALHYWNFGDGYVSYKANPIHIYATNGNFNVTGTIYDSYGPCGGTGGGGTGTGNVNSSSGSTGNNNGTYSCSPNLGGSFSVSGTGLILTFSGVATGFSSSGSNLDFLWSFGDNSFAHGSTVSHPYSTQGTFPVTLTITDLVTNCTWTSSSQNVFPTIPPPPPPTCCSKDDKTVNNWVYCDHDHKFQHILNVKHLIITTNGGSEVYGEVTQYHRIFTIFGGGFWWWQNATSGVNVSGTAYGLDQNNQTCNGTDVFNVNATQVGAYVWNTVYDYSAYPFLYTNDLGVSSSGTGFDYAPYKTTDVIYTGCQ